MRYCIDRIEGEVCVLLDENGQMSKCFNNDVPLDSKEGDWLVLENEKLLYDPVYTENTRLRIADKMKHLLR